MLGLIIQPILQYKSQYNFALSTTIGGL